MAIQGSKVKFVYLETGLRPANPDESTIYFAPESHSIFVGSNEIINGASMDARIDGLSTTVDEISQYLDDMGASIDINIEGEGDVLVDAQFDEINNVLVLTRGDVDPSGSESKWVVID